MASCYECLSAGVPEAEGAVRLRAHSIRFAAQYIALEHHHEGEGRLWRVKPKLHLFLEVCSEGSRPSTCWVYRDEDLGGTAVKLGRRKGGLLRPSSTSKNVLTRFKLKTVIPRMLVL